MKGIRLLLQCFLFAKILSIVNCETECYSDRLNPYRLFSTKTSYFAVTNEDAPEIEYEGCTPRSLWLLARHGTRNPGKKDIKKMTKNAANLQAKIIANHKNNGSLCDTDLDKLALWTFNLSLAEESQLTESGRSEHFQIAQRYKKRLNKILSGPFQKGTFVFRHTHKSRTVDSARAFARGMFPGDEETIFSQMPPSAERDKLLRFYDFCTKWIDEVDQSDETYVEQKAFVKTDHIANLVDRVSERLGFNPETGNILDLEDVLLIYDICRFEKAWHPNQVSVWCSAFKDGDLKVLEYHEELKYWYNSGYYYPINSLIACPLLQDLVEKFGGVGHSIDEESAASIPKGVFYFSHSEALLPFLSLLGLYRDDDRLKHDNFDQMIDRKYRTSKIGPFSSNIGFVLFDCKGEKKVLTLHQEKPVKLEKCRDFLCEWSEFIDIYNQKLSCNFEEICSIETTESTSSSNNNNNNNNTIIKKQEHSDDEDEKKINFAARFHLSPFFIFSICVFNVFKFVY